MKTTKYILLFIFTSLTIGIAQTNLNSLENEKLISIEKTADDLKPISFTEMKIVRSWTKTNINQKVHSAILVNIDPIQKDFIDSDLFLIMVGSAVAFGATAAYFKLESDKYYDQYLITKDKNLLDKTDKYDIYSGIALGALEINFGYLIYKFLSD